MGSLETGIPLKRDSHVIRSSSSIKSNNIHPFLQRPRSRFSRFMLFKKLDYLQWISTVAVFFFFVLIFQMFLPGSLIEKSENRFNGFGVVSRNFAFIKDIGGLDFGEDIRFEPSKLLAKFQKDSPRMNFSSSYNGTTLQFGFRKPQLALVFADLLIDPHQILMVTVAEALRKIGYAIQVYSLEDGPTRAVWEKIGIQTTVIQTGDNIEIPVDWLNYDGILVNSLEAKSVFSRFLQEPFKSLSLIWTIHEGVLANRLRQYNSSGQIELVNDWKRIFNRATVVVFPNYVLPMMYSTMDTGNFFVIPGSPTQAFEAENFMTSYKDDIRVQMGYHPDDFVITIVGSQILFRGLWLEHALVLQALFPLLEDFVFHNDNSSSHLKIVVLSGDSTGNYSMALEAIALNLRYPKGIVKHVAIDENEHSALGASDVVIYGCFHEEQSFPDILIKAMCLEKPIVAPDLSIIKNHVEDNVNGYLFPKKNIEFLTQIVLQIVSKGKLSPLSLKVASNGKSMAKNMMALQTIEGYASLVENILKLPSEVTPPKSVSEISVNLKENWQWNLFEGNSNSEYYDKNLRSYRFLEKIEQQWNRTQVEGYGDTAMEDSFVYSIWEEEKYIEMAYTRKRREEEELKDRSDQSRGTWEDVYRSAKRADRSRNELHEREDGDLERTGQPLSIYEPYFGEGAWPLLHRTSLYRGIGLSTRGRRPGADDIDAPSRLPLLSSHPYYRDVLGDYGAFFAIANRIDRVHKNSWIGFQSWRATAGKESLSKVAEKALLDDIQTQRHGDTLYFWVRMDTKQRNPLKRDFWSYCDALNAGNCKSVVSEALKKMYGTTHDLNLPPMPQDGDTWSVMNSWALPTRSFLEFVMFSRMFVDALDAKFYDEHHKNGFCHLSLYKDKHCYSRVLELLVNVWAYHSARRMIYVNPDTGSMQEQHKLKTRKGQIWIKWFSYTTLKSLDEDLAEEFDVDHPTRRWLWPLTGEVYWHGMSEKERNKRQQEKEKRKKQSKDKISRIRNRSRQKVIGKYVKPPPDETEVEETNSTTTTTVL